MSHFTRPSLVRYGRVVQCTIYQHYGGTAEAKGAGSAEAAPAGGETQTGSGASQSSLPAASRRDGGAIPHRAVCAAAAAAGGHRHSDPLQVTATTS